MISLTKEEMEDIWQNKPYGYWTKFRKQNRGMKRYKVTIQPFKTEYYEKREITVMAKNSTAAIDKAKSQLYDQYRPTGLIGWRLIKAELV